MTRIDAVEATFVFPLNQLRFVEIPPGAAQASSTRMPAWTSSKSAASCAAGSCTGVIVTCRSVTPRNYYSSILLRRDGNYCGFGWMDAWYGFLDIR